MNNSSTRCFPNLFLIGAPKCGTTSLFDYLVRYRECGAGSLKEPHYFSTDLPEMAHVKSLDEYLRLFGDTQTNEHLRYVVDASTNYLYSDVACSQILSFNKSSKFIVMLRNPVDLVTSLYHHLRYRQVEPCETFLEAWNAGELTERVSPFVRKSPFPGHLVYADAGKLGERYQYLQGVIPPSQLHTIFFDDLIEFPAKTLGKACQFLDLDFDPKIEFGRRNRRKRARSKLLNRLLLHPPQFLKPWKKIVKASIPIGLIRVANIYDRIGSRANSDQDMVDPTTTEMVRLHLQKDIELLSSLSSRNLDPWLSHR